MESITIRFLGTSSAHPIPRWGCTCPQCTEARTNPRFRRTRSSILINGFLLVDAGPDVYAQLGRLPYGDIPEIDQVIITHPHADHYLGLDDLSGLRHTSELAALPIFALGDGWPLIQQTFRYLIAAEMSEYDTRPFARQEMAIGEPLELRDGLVVTPIDSHHTQPFTTAALLIERAGQKVLYAPDFHDAESNRLQGADVVILDGSFLSNATMKPQYAPRLEEGMGRHRPLVEGLSWARSIGARRVIITHIGHLRMSNSDLCGFLTEQDTIPCSLAYDELVITI